MSSYMVSFCLACTEFLYAYNLNCLVPFSSSSGALFQGSLRNAFFQNNACQKCIIISCKTIWPTEVCPTDKLLHMQSHGNPFLYMQDWSFMGQDSLEECPVVSMKIPNRVGAMWTLISVVCVYSYLDCA